MTASTAAPSTPPYRCDGCLQKSQSIVELRRRISNLYWIRDEEKLLDSVTTLGAGPPVNASELDSTILLTDAAQPATVRPADASVFQPAPGPGGASAAAGLAVAVLPSHPQPVDHWHSLGAKPKLLPATALDFTPNPRHRALSSTPRHQPWQSVAGSRRAHRTSPQPTCELHLSNRYEALSLQDFPPLGARSSSPPGPVHPAGRGSGQPRSRGLCVQSGPSSPSGPGTTAARCRQPRVPSRQRRNSQRRNSRQPAEQRAPSVLVVGTSMVRHVRIHGGRTFCRLGARIKEVESSALQLCAQHSSASTLVLDAGIGDIKDQQSETLKRDFISMVDHMLDTGKRLIISGPLPPPRYGDVTTSRLRQLHLWLKGFCLGRSIPYVDNFIAFLNRPHLFKSDGLHPNQEGSRLLSVNIDLTLRSCTTTS
ncbi:hypothetical protein D4764_0229340 [Xyrichtys novacula]|uniref:SGNH hydrolase-type esterase domain-containing protein n=1 Tax=Xyrichtys novacula TaxID=13765 RepID=A0AAV1F9H3_XYRNO|nr:hypothetical protein D4764_0229340 [Xyrichtys novacula]